MRLPILLLSLLLSLFTLSAFAEEAAPPRSATLPLEEVLRLHQAEQDQSRIKAPPVAATLTRLELEGRVLEQALDLTAQVEVEVLGEHGWATVPLLARGKDLAITALPRVENGSFFTRDGYLCFSASKPGRYAFSLSLLKKTPAQAGQRRAELVFADAAYAALQLRADENLFKVAADGAVRRGDALLFYPQDNRFTVQWQQTAQTKPAPERGSRPPVDPVVTAAHASVVGTLAGKRVLRLRYELGFEGTRELRIAIPPEQTLDKVYLNGAPIQFSLSQQTLALRVAPARAGDQTGVVELVLSEAEQSYHLSGSLALNFPQPDWPVHRMYATLHLPEVFKYRWAGGSLAETGSVPGASYAYSLPTPGKTLALHQDLVASAASVRVDYDVDLTGRYFGGAASPVQAAAVTPEPSPETETRED